MAGIGHNLQSLSAAAEANLQTGVLLLCKEALITAIQDRRLERAHLRVLAAIATFINTKTAKAWPDRASISAMTGMSPKTVSNTLLELRNLGYLIAERECVPEAGNKRLTVYTFGNIDHDTIRKAITDFVHAIRAGRGVEKSPPAGNSDIPHQRGQSPYPGNQKSPPAGNFPKYGEQKVPAHGAEKSPPAGDSNLNKELIDVSQVQRDVIWIENNAICGHGFALDIGAIEQAAFLTGSSRERALALAEMMARDWSRNKFIPQAPMAMFKKALQNDKNTGEIHDLQISRLMSGGSTRRTLPR